MITSQTFPLSGSPMNSAMANREKRGEEESTKMGILIRKVCSSFECGNFAVSLKQM